MHDDLYNEIFVAAQKLYHDYLMGPKGPMIINMDRFEYWVAMVAYGKGWDEGFGEGYEDGLSEMPEELG